MIWHYVLVISCIVIAGAPFLMAQHEQIRRVRHCSPCNCAGETCGKKVCTGR